MAQENHKQIESCPKKYPWAVNIFKLNIAYTHIKWAKENDPKIELDEKTIKEKYIELNGLLEEDRIKNLKIKRPKSTSNIK